MIAPNVRFDDLVEAHLRQLVEDGAREGRTLEFKQELPGGTDEAKREFLQDVSSFANAGGGDLIYGSREREGIAAELVALDINPDADILRLAQVLRSGVEPRLPGLRIRAIPVDGGHAVVIGVPRSWVGPHAVTVRGSFRFFSRTSAGKHQLDVAELRAAFLAASELGEQMRDFQAGRLGRIIADETPVPVQVGAKIVVHMIPYSALTEREPLPLPAVEPTGLFWPLFAASRGSYTGWNIDGLLTYDTGRDEGVATRYSQLFRNGIFEGVDSRSLGYTGHDTFHPPVLRGNDVEAHLNNRLGQPLAALERIDAKPPIAILVALLGVRDRLVLTGDRSDYLRELHRIDRDTVLLPEALVEEYAVDYGDVVAPLIEAFWQSGGLPGTPP